MVENATYFVILFLIWLTTNGTQASQASNTVFIKYNALRTKSRFIIIPIDDMGDLNFFSE